MGDTFRITLYIICFIGSAYALNGVDFSKMMRKNATLRVQMLYILLSMALGFLVAQFLMGLSNNYFM